MKSSWNVFSKAALIATLPLLSGAQALAELPIVPPPTPTSMIEVGVGGAALGNSTPVEALLRVDFDGFKAGTVLVLAKFSGAIAGNPDGVNYIDIQFDLANFNTGWLNDSFAFNVGSVDLQRNVAVGNNINARVSLAGIRAEGVAIDSKEVKLLLRGALDLFALGFQQNRDGDTLVSAGAFGLGGAVEMRVLNRFRVVLGERLGVVNDVREMRSTGSYDCHTDYEDWDGDGFYDDVDTHCQENYKAVNADRTLTSKTSLDLIYDITRNLSVFGRGELNVYQMTAIRDEVPSSESDSALQFMFGVSGRF